MTYRAALPLLFSALLLPALLSGCGKASPVAPTGSTVTLSANPSELTSPTGTSTITAVVRKPNGTVAAGVDVRFTTTIGNIDVLKATDSGGIATATLRGDGRSGTAMVNAAVDGGATATALSVTIGGSAKTITLQAIPASIAASGGSAKLVALVRDGTGQPSPGVQVNFTTTVGTLDSRGGFRTTNSSGQATDTLVIQASDITNQTSITVTATAAASDGTLETATATVAVVNPNAAGSITVSANPGTFSAAAPPNKVTLTALVLNTAGIPIQGANVFFSATLGKLAITGTVPTGPDGTASNTLTFPNGVTAGTITITVQAPGVGGALISGTTTITVNP